jgi:hypothetical protein
VGLQDGLHPSPWLNTFSVRYLGGAELARRAMLLLMLPSAGSHTPAAAFLVVVQSGTVEVSAKDNFFVA